MEMNRLVIIVFLIFVGHPVNFNVWKLYDEEILWQHIWVIKRVQIH